MDELLCFGGALDCGGRNAWVGKPVGRIVVFGPAVGGLCCACLAVPVSAALCALGVNVWPADHENKTCGEAKNENVCV